MYLLWLRVAAILYAAASVAVFPAVLYGLVRWRKICVHLGGMALFFHFVSAVEMLVQAHRWMPVGVREVESLLGLGVAGAVLPGLVALRRYLAWNLRLAGNIFPGFGARAGAGPLHVSLRGRAHQLAGSPHYRAADGLCALWFQPAGLGALPDPGTPHQEQTEAGPGLLVGPFDWLPPLDTLERIAHATLEFGFPCMTVGLVIGSVLAQETPLGAAYFLDPKIIAVVCHLGSLRRAAAGTPQRRPARAQGGLSFRRGVCGDGGGVGGQPLQPRAQVRCPMTLALIGVNHKTAPIEVREQIAISREDLPETTRALAATPGVTECMIVSTCNRVELLAAVDSPRYGSDRLSAPALRPRPGVAGPHIYEQRDRDAVRHLFRVAASLDSMVVGEPQILGQVKEAFAVARASGTVAGQLEHLLQSAFAAAKKVRTETEIGSSSVSIASVAVDLARKIFGSLQGRTVFLVGAGKMSELAARHLVQQGAGAILVSNRTHGTGAADGGAVSGPRDSIRAAL